LNYIHSSLALGSLSLHRTMESNTLSAYISFCSDTNQFVDKAAVMRGAEQEEMLSNNDDEIIVGEMTAGVTFFNSVPAGQLGTSDKVPDLSDRLNDQLNFHVRVPALTKIVTPYLKRLHPDLAGTSVRGFMFVEQIRAAPGFSEMDVLSAGVQQLRMLTAGSSEGIFWMHSELGELKTKRDLHRVMAQHHKFKRTHPDPLVTTFPDIGPLSGTLAGIIPAASRWEAGDDYSCINTSFEIDPQWSEDVMNDFEVEQ